MSTDRKLYIDTAHLETIVLGASRVCDALEMGPYSHTLQGITGRGTPAEQGAAALKFLSDYYDLTAGTLELIAGAVSFLADGIADNDLEFSIVEQGRQTHEKEPGTD